MQRQYSKPDIVVAALYKFADLADFEQLRSPLLEVCRSNHIYGTLLLAHEGINGTIAGSRSGLDAVVAHIRSDERLKDLEYKESHAETMPFHRMKVRLKKEIVTLGVPGVSPTLDAGTYVKADEWNALISDPDVVVIDTRNDYEIAIGTFEGAINPKTTTFRELPAKLAGEPALKNKPKVAMFCTGGIRCEKSTAYLRSLGFADVYHLEGGILRYLETVPEEASLWRGECFVFDGRVSVKHGLELGDFEQCHGCRRPVSKAETEDERYIPGCCCPSCYKSLTKEKHERFSERHKQVELAEQRGERHLGRLRKPPD